MSPEQARGDRSIDGRSDLYSLGCVLYGLLAGVPPFEGVGWSVLVQHVSREPVPVLTLRPEVPDVLNRLIRDLLRKEPEQRPANAQEVLDRLLSVLDRLDRPLPVVEAPAADATVTAESASLRTAAPISEPGSPATTVLLNAPRVARVSAWSGVLAAGCIFAQFSALTHWSPFWISMVSVLAFLVVSLLAGAFAPSSGVVREGDADGPGDCMSVLCALLAAAFLLVWPSSAWWTAPLAMFLGLPLSALARKLRRRVESVARRAAWQGSVGTATGLLNGVVLAGLLAVETDGLVLAALIAGAVAWVVVALLVAFLLPSCAESDAS